MKLTDMKVELIKIPLKKPFRIAFAVQDHSVNVLVKLITDEGLWVTTGADPQFHLPGRTPTRWWRS